MTRLVVVLAILAANIALGILLYPSIYQISGNSSLLAMIMLVIGAVVAFFLANLFVTWLFGVSRPKKKSALRSGRTPKNDFEEILRYFTWNKGKTVLLAIVVLLVYTSRYDVETYNRLISIGATLLQFLLFMSFAIIQFAAIFWFMSQTKKTKIEPGDPKEVTLKDYWGQPRLVEAMTQYVKLLRGIEEFQEMGGQLINGLLLKGPPGTGKTFLAKAVAGEAGVAFFAIEGSGFRGMFLGVDTLRVIEFFSKMRGLARKWGACVGFIDEIDAVGASRGGTGQGGQMGMGGMFGGSGSGALTRILYEMDGIDEFSRVERFKTRIAEMSGFAQPKRNWHVMVMGATNRAQDLDAALLRPGRFDVQIQVDPPDRMGRREIIKGYLGKIRCDKALGDTAEIEALVEATPGYTPAQIMSAITKGAVRIALFQGAKEVSYQHIDKALEEQRFGLEQPIEELEPRQRELLAYHESGHAVAAHYLHPTHRLNRLTIIRHSEALGYLEHLPPTEIYALPLEDLVRDIRISYAGHVAARGHFKKNWTGGSGDFQNIHQRINALAAHGYFGIPLPSNPNPDGIAKLLEKEDIKTWLKAQ
ncbi:MAG: AAA family ATPase, partial [Chloroflexota bacterium]